MTPKHWMLTCVLIAAIFAPGLFAQPMPQERELVPESFQLDEAALNAINAPWLTEDERKQLRVFHGIWDDRDLATIELRAHIALNAWRFEDNSLWEPGTPVELRAEARLLAGDLQAALDMLADGGGGAGGGGAAGGARSNHAARLRAQALEGLGRHEEADRAIDDLIKRMQSARITDPAELTEGVRAMLIRSRLQEQPARDFQTMMTLLARAHQELDRLYWPAKLVEAELLLEKDNFEEAVAALHETLSLNPRCAEAWHALGEVAISRFDFASAQIAADALRRLNPRHPLADLLLAQSRLTQDDPEGAQDILNPLLEKFPQLRPALALHAAAQALTYDHQATKAALDRYDVLSPNSPQAYYTVGKHLSFNRQYEAAAEMLEEAIRRQPAWPAPQIDLGLMEMQSGRDDRALAVLQSVVKLDPFNQRAAFSLHLLEELTKYAVLESEHFIVRHAPPPSTDVVMAEMMLEKLEEIHAIVSKRFNHEPPRKTIIELHPNHPRFAVRITGMPFVHTIAACTGPVIALEVPREGRASQHRGLFDWPRVIQHEYTHTITLDQTRNRIPHWLTEAAAVSMEPGPRTYETCQMLASAYHSNTIFGLDELKWAFIRPKLPGDRGKAYAISHWMVEYMNERFGESALVRLLERYHAGEREQQAIPAALGVSREQFYVDFLEWAGAEVKAWGLGAEPSVIELMDELRWADPDKAIVMAASQQARLDVIVEALTEEIGRPAEARAQKLTADRWPPIARPPVEVTDAILDNWIQKYPDHPDLAELKLRRYLASIGDRPQLNPDDQTLINLLETYAKLRPVDPLPHKRLALLWLESDTPARAIPHLEELDIREEKSPVHAVTLAKLYREQAAAARASGAGGGGGAGAGAGGIELEKAMAKATRALYINPYSAPNRELAAAIALEAKKYDLARQHIIALTILEPDRPQHAKRLEAVEKLVTK